MTEDKTQIEMNSSPEVFIEENPYGSDIEIPVNSQNLLMIDSISSYQEYNRENSSQLNLSDLPSLPDIPSIPSSLDLSQAPDNILNTDSYFSSSLQVEPSYTPSYDEPDRSDELERVFNGYKDINIFKKCFENFLTKITKKDIHVLSQILFINMMNDRKK